MSLGTGEVSLKIPVHDKCSHSIAKISSMDKRPYVAGLVNAQPYLMLLDSGASASCLSDTLASSLGVRVTKDVVPTFSADGQALTLEGVATVTLTLGGKPFFVSCLVIKSLAVPVIVGSDVLQAARASIRYEDSTVVLWDQKGSVTIPLETFSTGRQTYVNFVSCRKEISTVVLDTGEVLCRGDLDAGNIDFQTADRSWGGSVPEDSKFVLDNPNLSDEERTKVETFVQGWQKRFADSPGLLNGYEAEIYVKEGQKPVRCRPYRLAMTESMFVQKEVDRLLAEGKIEPASGLYAAPCFTVKKQDSADRRLVINYKQLNDTIEGYQGGTPLASDVIMALRANRWRTRLDMTASFHQILLCKKSRQYLSFITPSGAVYCPKVLLMGYKNSTAMFSSAMRHVLAPLIARGHIALFVDDIFVFSNNSLDDHLAKVAEVLELLRSRDMSLNFRKLAVCPQKLKVLGHVLEEDTCAPCPSKVESVKNLKPPRTVREVRKLLGLVNFYRAYIPNVSLLLAPLYDLLKANVKFHWDERHSEAFETVKNILCSSPILALPDPQGRYSVEVDASQTGCGAVLYTHGSGEADMPTAGVVEFFSKRFSPTEQRYNAAEREMLGLIMSLEHFSPYIKASPFPIEVFCDNSAVVWLFRQEHTKSKLFRYRCRLNAFNLIVKHKKGSTNTVPDFLSRIDEPDKTIVGTVHEHTINAVTKVQNFDFANSPDQFYDKLRAKILRFPKKYPSFRVENDLIIKHVKEGLLRETVSKLIVPTDFRLRIMAAFHDTNFGCHLGVRKSMANIMRGGYYWSSMRKDLSNYIKSCTDCAKAKASHAPPEGLMRVRPHSDQVMNLVYIDIVGPLCRGRKKNKYILTILDNASRFLIAKPLKQARTCDVIETLLREVILVYGAFEAVVSDNATIFRSKEMQEWLSSFDIRHYTIPLYSPSRNAVERTHSSIKNCLRALSQTQEDWDSLLDYITFALNASPHGTTGISPHSLMFGRSLRSPHDKHSDLLSGKLAPFDADACVKEQTEKQKKIWSLVKDIALKNKTAQAKTYNLRRKESKLQVGDFVYKKSHYLSSAINNFTSSLADKWEGPFRISRMCSATQIELSNLNGQIVGVYAVEDLKLFFDRELLFPSSPQP